VPEQPTPDDVKSAMVFFVDHQGRFIGNGVFVAPNWVLTARHVVGVEGGKEVWKNERFARSSHPEMLAVGTPIHRVEMNTNVDVALVELAATPKDVVPLQLTERSAKVPDEMVFAGILPRSKALFDHPVCYAGLLGTTGCWTFRGNAEHGHSGSAARAGGKLVGILVARNSSSTEAHIVPVSVMWPWLEKVFPAGLPHRTLTKEDRFKPHFDYQTYVDAHLSQRRGALPFAVQNALAEEEPRRVGDRCVLSILTIQHELTTRGPAKPHWQAERRGMRSSLTDAMGLAALLCMRPDARSEAFEKLGQVTAIQASHALTAMLLMLQEKAPKSWKLRPKPSKILDATTTSMLDLSEREYGNSDEDQKKGVLEAAHKYFVFDSKEAADAFTAESGPGARQTDDRAHELRAHLGASEPIVGKRVARIADAETHKFSDEVLRWMDEEMGVPPVVLTGRADVNELFFVRERDLVKKIAAFLETFEEEPWR
jgi:hypothetical protein